MRTTLFVISVPPHLTSRRRSRGGSAARDYAMIFGCWVLSSFRQGNAADQAPVPPLSNPSAKIDNSRSNVATH